MRQSTNGPGTATLYPLWHPNSLPTSTLLSLTLENSIDSVPSQPFISCFTGTLPWLYLLLKNSVKCGCCTIFRGLLTLVLEDKLYFCVFLKQEASQPCRRRWRRRLSWFKWSCHMLAEKPLYSVIPTMIFSFYSDYSSGMCVSMCTHIFRDKSWYFFFVRLILLIQYWACVSCSELYR